MTSRDVTPTVASPAPSTPKDWVVHTLTWPPLRNTVKRAVHVAARGRGAVIERRGDIPSPANIYAAGPQKAGSQWIKALFDHPLVREATGLFTLPQFDYQHNPPRRGFPVGTFIPGYYCSYEEFLAVPRKHDRKAIYLSRDPRTMVVSGYWSAVGSHPPLPSRELEQIRDELRRMPMDDALLRIIGMNKEFFETMDSWIGVDDPDVARFRLEDVATDDAGQVKAMFDHCDIHLSSSAFEQVLRETSRAALQAKDLAHRKPDTEGHYRSQPSDYREVFTAAHHAAFEQAAPGLIRRLGYDAG